MSDPRRGSAVGHVFLVGLASIPLAFFSPAPSADGWKIPGAPLENASAVSSAPPAAVQPNLAVFSEGERLEYEVSYLAIKLGSIVTRVLDIDTLRDRILYRTDCFIRTYKGVPFVTMRTRFQSTITDSISSASFSTKEWIADTTHKYINYTYHRGTGNVYISERIGNRPVPQNYDTLSLEGKRWQDGLSLFFYARVFAHIHASVHAPVLIYRSKANTYIRFGVENEAQEIDAVNYPVSTVKLDGETGFTGIFGLTGGFEGWFSRDRAAIPITAKMHVIIGSVRVELIKWNRKDWSPPRIAGRMGR